MTQGPKKRTDWEAWRAQIRAANQARYRATQILISENLDRFDSLYADQCRLVGVTPKPRSRLTAVEEIEQEIDQLRRRLEIAQRREDSAS